MFKVGAVILAMLTTVIVTEGAYRIKLLLSGAFSTPAGLTYHVVSSPFGIFDAEFGVTYASHAKLEYFNVSNGRVVWCSGPVFITNVDGLSGLTTISQYNTSQVKVLVFGDSFTQWNQQGKTWPDLLEAKLSRYYNTKVGVLNFGRSGYGVLQMTDLAAKMAELYRPHLVISAFTSYDLTRDRWWIKTVEINGAQRILRSPQRENFDLRIATDTDLINPAVSQEWCAKNLNKAGDALLQELNRQFGVLWHSIAKARGYKFYSVFSLTDLYLYNRILKKEPLHQPGHISSLPHVEFDDFRKDSRFVADIEVLKKHNYFFVHLPAPMKEIESNRILVDSKSLSLFNSLKVVSDGNLYELFEYLKSYRIPSKIDQLPYDVHPNYDGLEMYSDMVFELITQKRHPSTAWQK